MNSTIRFCSQCDNKYYHSIEENQLKYYCRVCGNTETNVSKEALCVLDTQFQKDALNFDHLVNRYTKFDPTLPHIFLRCPSDNCKTNIGSDPSHVTDAIYIRYDNHNLKFLYICTECDFKWKTD
jgi:DNA-directed RNA polymerase subunit M/transcription elongation factor TFIIS